jgi:hypothetical protein
MSKKIVSTAILAGLLFGLAAPIAQGQERPQDESGVREAGEHEVGRWQL